MSNLVAYRNAICSTLAADANLTGCSIYDHGGGFDLAELKAVARKPPAVIVSIVKAQGMQNGGEPLALVTVSLVVLTVDRPGVRRDVRALQIVEALLNILMRFPNQSWGLDYVGSVDDAQSQNLYSRKLDDEGTALWGIAFHQKVYLDPSAYQVTDDFAQFHAQWDLSPRDNDADLGDVPEAEDDVAP